MPDIETSGGNVNVNTSNFTGEGSLDAIGIGTPRIDINNGSSAYLITNRLTIADKGGAINYNGKSIKNNDEINDLNASKSGSAFTEIKISDSADIPTITVENSYAGQSSIPMKLQPKPDDEGYKKLPEDAKTKTQQYTPINYIEIAGNITNPVGKVQISNKQGSIRINGSATVNAQDIEMTAKQSISQGYTDGIVNIGYTPEAAYANEIKKLRDKIGWDKNMPTKDDKKTESSDEIYKGGSAWQAGNAIYISARDININGLIQSGFNGVSMYKVNSGGAKLGSDGYYIYEPQVYYDKENNKLYVEDINSTGGKIEQAEGTKISTDNIKLSALADIKNIDIEYHRTHDLILFAQTTLGNIDVNVSGGILDDKNLAGNIIIAKAIYSPSGAVSLTAQGDIKQAITGTAITARNIKLDSLNGAINLQIESNGQSGAEYSAISAAANGDINLVKNVTADFLVGSIISENGDVELKAGGKFVDALDKERDNAGTDESDLVKSWIDMGLIAGTADYKGAYLAADKDYQTLVETVKNPQYKWTEDELLSGIRSALVNKEEGTAHDVTHFKDANITGRNVTLTGTGVGSNSKEVTTIKMSELKPKANETDKEKSARLAKLSILANVEAADVKVNLALDAGGKPVTQTITQVNYNYDADKAITFAIAKTPTAIY